jgi:hypothetical protein
VREFLLCDLGVVIVGGVACNVVLVIVAVTGIVGVRKRDVAMIVVPVVGITSGIKNRKMNYNPKFFIFAAILIYQV